MENNKLIEKLLQTLQEDLLSNNIDIDYIYSYLNNYEIDNNIDITYTLNKINNNKYNKINLLDNSLEVISNDYVMDNTIVMNLTIKEKNIVSIIDKIIKYLDKEKIQYKITIFNKLINNNININLTNKLDIFKLSEYINKKINKEDLYQVNPLYINDSKISYNLSTKLSYNYIVSYYIYLFLNEIKDKHIVTSNEFYSFMLKHSQNINECHDLSNYLELNKEKNNIDYLIDFEIITNELFEVIKRGTLENIFELNDLYNNIEYKDKLIDKYKSFNDISLNETLLNKIIIAMITKYGYQYTLNSLLEFSKSYNVNLITRTNNLRSEVINSTSFITYLNTINIKDKVDIINKELGIKEEDLTSDLILENICKETYLSCQNEEKKYSGKIQVARSLIRLTYGDYSGITRTNNARKIAKEKLLPEEIEEIIKISLEKNGYIIESESDLYELYATHISHICNKEGKVLC